MIKREISKKDNSVKLTFIQPVNGQSVMVLGDFNGWDSNKGKLVKRANGTASLSVSLEPGTQVEFRYRREDGTWFNEEAADAYAPNECGETNSVVVA
ncbi:MAG: isoamylase early set domain-containing protein [Caldilineaceae bacterium]